MRVSRNRGSLWRTELFQLLGMLVYVGLVELLVQATNPSFSGTSLVIVSVILAMIPAVLWLSMFYIQDRFEPEPRTYVLLVAVLGGLLAAAVGEPLINNVFRAPSWIGTDTMTEILGSILVVGFTQEFLKYAAVRFSIYYSSEFDQRVDGVVYGSAAGLGYATVLNVLMVVSSGGIDLGVGVVRIVITALVQGTLGGLIGYFLGRDKFDRMPVWWMPLGVGIAAVVEGLFSWLRGEITSAPIAVTSSGIAQGGYNPWPGLILAAALAAVLLGVVFTLMRADLRSDERMMTSPPSPALPSETA
jgi:RsiW-degrading membrane proteinase PrsW (M82 family)